MSKNQEATEQMKFMNLVNFGLPEHQSTLVWHTPNGEHRDPRTAIKLKKMGTRKGVPDLFAAIPRPPHAGWFCEMKRSAKEKPSKAQEALHGRLREEGFVVKVHHQAHDAFIDLVEYLNG